MRGSNYCILTLVFAASSETGVDAVAAPEEKPDEEAEKAEADVSTPRADLTAALSHADQCLSQLDCFSGRLFRRKIVILSRKGNQEPTFCSGFLVVER